MCRGHADAATSEDSIRRTVHLTEQTFIRCFPYNALVHQEAPQTELLGLTTAPKDSSFYPEWSHGGAMRYYDRSMAHGQWSAEAGPPYVKHVTMWSDPSDVDHTGPANNVRRILGLQT
eukprot:102473-Rhodomonas_salina.1